MKTWSLLALDWSQSTKRSKSIRLVHYTTQEYFERTQKIWFLDAKYNITTFCITYLLFRVFQSGFCSTDKEFEKRLESNPLYDYSARNWGYHAHKSSTLGQELIHFLEYKEGVEASIQALIAGKPPSVYSGYSQRFPKQMTGLHLAAYFGVQEAANSLLEHIHVLDLRDSYGRTPLSWAAENGHEPVVKLLLDKGADVESKNEYGGLTPLFWAAENGHEAVVKLLLDNGADPESKDNFGRTPLSEAAEEGHEAIIPCTSISRFNSVTYHLTYLFICLLICLSIICLFTYY